MTNIELVLNMLAEVTTTALSKQEKPQTFKENKNIARRGGNVANTAKQAYEEQLGQKVVSPLNAQNKQMLEIKMMKINDLTKGKRVLKAICQ